MRKLFVLFVFTACTSAEHSKLNQQSIEMHEAALEVGRKVNEKIEKISLEAESGLDSAFLDSLSALKLGYEEWSGSIVEVPGYEHDHHDHEGHDHDHHDHGSSPDLTPEMVLEIQTELKKGAEKLERRVDVLLEQINAKSNEATEEEEASGNGS